MLTSLSMRPVSKLIALLTMSSPVKKVIFWRNMFLPMRIGSDRLMTTIRKIWRKLGRIRWRVKKFRGWRDLRRRSKWWWSSTTIVQMTNTRIWPRPAQSRVLKCASTPNTLSKTNSKFTPKQSWTSQSSIESNRTAHPETKKPRSSSSTKMLLWKFLWILAKMQMFSSLSTISIESIIGASIQASSKFFSLILGLTNWGKRWVRSTTLSILWVRFLSRRWSPEPVVLQWLPSCGIRRSWRLSSRWHKLKK